MQRMIHGWKQQALLKHHNYIFSSQHSVLSQKTWFFLYSAVRTSRLTCNIYFGICEYIFLKVQDNTMYRSPSIKNHWNPYTPSLCKTSYTNLHMNPFLVFWMLPASSMKFPLIQVSKYTKREETEITGVILMGNNQFSY